MSNNKIPDIGIHHLSLHAVDFEKSVKFYTEGLGFTKVVEWGEGAGRGIFLDIGNGNHFEIFADGNENEQKNAKFGHIAILTSDPDTAYANAISAGAIPQTAPFDVDMPTNPAYSVRIAFVRGPDGEVLEFFKVRG